MLGLHRKCFSSICMGSKCVFQSNPVKLPVCSATTHGISTFSVPNKEVTNSSSTLDLNVGQTCKKQICVSNFAQHMSSNISGPSSLYTLGPLWQAKHFLVGSPFHRTIPCRSYSVDPTIVAKVRGIQKDISPLSTRRVVRRKRTKDSVARDQVVFDVVAYATAEELNLESLEKAFNAKGLYGVCKMPNDVSDALHFEAKYRVNNEPREIYLFREGCVVFWNMPEVERNDVLKSMKHHQEDSYDSLLISQEFEQVEFTFTDSNTNLIGDELHLQKPGLEHEAITHQLEKYAFSNALSLSVKLAIWEASLAKYVDSIEYILQDMTDGRKIKISRAEVLIKTGELFTLRHLINLSSDLLDVPDFYWDREDLEQLYTKTCNYLSINRRTKVMNEKLHHCCELMDLLSSHLNDKHHTRLEWMIIILILVEVMFELEKVLGRFLP